MTLQVAQTILAQLGGKRFIAMTGSKNFVGSEKAISFKVGRNAKKVTHFRVTLDENDTYSVEFMKWNARALEMKTIKKSEGVYCDMLQDIFTEETGLYTRL